MRGPDILVGNAPFVALLIRFTRSHCPSPRQEHSPTEARAAARPAASHCHASVDEGNALWRTYVKPFSASRPPAASEWLAPVLGACSECWQIIAWHEDRRQIRAYGVQSTK